MSMIRNRSARPGDSRAVGSIVPPSGSENDIGADRNPKGVVADKGDLDEHPHNCEPRKNERERKSKIHYASPLHYDRKQSNGGQRSRSHTIALGTVHLTQHQREAADALVFRGSAQDTFALAILRCGFAKGGRDCIDDEITTTSLKSAAPQ